MLEKLVKLLLIRNRNERKKEKINNSEKMKMKMKMNMVLHRAPKKLQCSKSQDSRAVKAEGVT